MSEHVHYLKPPKVKRSKGRARPDEPLADWCEVSVPGVCTGRAQVRHHVQRRGQSGSDDASNTLDVCDADHRWIHDHPAISYERGWLRHAGAA